MRDRFLALAPVLIGVLIGVWAQYVADGVLALVLASLGGASAIGYWLGRRLLPGKPYLAIYVYQLLIALPILVVAVVTTISTWLAISLEPLLAKSDNPELAADAKVVSGVLIGAIGAFLSGMWLDEAENPKSSIWPAKNIKDAFSDVYAGIADALDGADRIDVADAISKDRVARGDIRGWGVGALKKRLGIILEDRQ